MAVDVQVVLLFFKIKALFKKKNSAKYNRNFQTFSFKDVKLISRNSKMKFALVGFSLFAV